MKMKMKIKTKREEKIYDIYMFKKNYKIYK